jgi:hypothetical protein
MQGALPLGGDGGMARFALSVFFGRIDGAQLWRRARHERRIASADRGDETKRGNERKSASEPSGCVTTRAWASWTHEGASRLADSDSILQRQIAFRTRGFSSRWPFDNVPR